jgi:aspartyl-tRNA(Asn)/glutamyl-tRNA(Gln) amidotransferase subunit A
MTVDTLRLTAEEATRLLEAGEVSGAELFAAYRAAIDERDPELHAYLALCDDPGGDGVPIAIKDVIGTKGVTTTAGSKMLESYVPVYDATVTARCKARGLKLLGKTNTDEFAMGSSTENSAFGPTRNPWDPTRVPGGSGGGSAAAVAAGLAPWALGSDTGGSIKQPAALCANVGLRPTYGTVSRYGVVAFASSLDQVGPVARNVRDCALLYSIISGRDENDSTTVEVPPVELPDAEDLKGLRVGVPKELNEAEGIEPGVSDRVREAIELAESLGASVEECSLPRSVDYGLACYYLVAPAEASSNLARYDGVRYGLRSEGVDFRSMVMASRHDGLGDEPKRRIMVGTYALSSGYYDAYYGKAQQVRTVIKREHDEAFQRFDVLVSPTSPTVAFPLGAKADNPLAMYLSDLLTIPSCMAGLPGLSVPCGFSEGLPVGLQLVGPQFSENTLFRTAHALERALALDTVPTRYRA